MRDNIMDNSPKKRSDYSKKGVKTKLDKKRSFEERCEIYKLIYDNVDYNYISEKYNISKPNISYIKSVSFEYKEFLESISGSSNS